MKTKLLKKLRKLAKERIRIECEVIRNNTTYTIYENGSLSCGFKSRDRAIDRLNKERREYILIKLDNIKEEKLNKELSKI